MGDFSSSLVFGYWLDVINQSLTNLTRSLVWESCFTYAQSIGNNNTHTVKEAFKYTTHYGWFACFTI